MLKRGSGRCHWLGVLAPARVRARCAAATTRSRSRRSVTVAAANSPRRGRLRWYIAGLLFLSTVINYIDRQTFSVLGPYLKTDKSSNPRLMVMPTRASRS